MAINILSDFRTARTDFKIFLARVSKPFKCYLGNARFLDHVGVWHDFGYIFSTYVDGVEFTVGARIIWLVNLHWTRQTQTVRPSNFLTSSINWGRVRHAHICQLTARNLFTWLFPNLKYLFWMQYYNLIYLDYFTVRFLVNAIVASIWDLAGNCIILKYVLLPILFDFKEAPGVL